MNTYQILEVLNYEISACREDLFKHNLRTRGFGKKRKAEHDKRRMELFTVLKLLRDKKAIIVRKILDSIE